MEVVWVVGGVNNVLNVFSKKSNFGSRKLRVVEWLITPILISLVGTDDGPPGVETRGGRGGRWRGGCASVSARARVLERVEWTLEIPRPRRDPRALRVVALPRKPLVMIAGVPMIVRTYEQAKQAKTLTRLVVATDDARIKAACEAAGAEVVMTDSADPGTAPSGAKKPWPRWAKPSTWW